MTDNPALEDISVPHRSASARAFLATICLSLIAALPAAATPAPIPTSRTVAAWAPLPAPTGTLPVGTAIYEWTDRNRDDYVSPVVGDKRRIKVQIWYPSADGPAEQDAPYIDAAILNELPEWSARLSALHLPIRLNAPVSVRHRQYPLIVFSPGLGMSRSYYTALLADLASHGYIVAAIDHPYVGMVALDEQIAPPYSPWNDPPPGGLRDAREEVRDAHWREANLQLSSDQRFALDQLSRLAAANADGRFAGRMDLDRIGFLGHSKGFVSLTCSQDMRIKACVNLMGVPAWAERERGFRSLS